MNKKLFFKDSIRIFETSSPGRMDVMGGIADYSGSLLLQQGIKESCKVRLGFRDDDVIRAYSTDAGDEKRITETSWPALLERGKLSIPKVRKVLGRDPADVWTLYAIGCALILFRDKKINVPGFDLYVESGVPLGKGVASSAALEVSVMKALCKGLKLKLDKLEFALLCQRVENEVVGAACGLMDQLACSLAVPGKLLPIQCKPAWVGSTVEIPKGLHFIGIDSGVRHSVGGASYGDVRTAAFMGLAMIQKIHKKSLKGYLANLSVSEFEQHYASMLPSSMKGSDFLKKYGPVKDKLTSVDKSKTYDVFHCTRHPVYTNHRVALFQALLPLRDVEALGELMYQEHASYSACGLGTKLTDNIVEMVRKAGPDQGVYGAKITGGGSGGTVCILTKGVKGKETVKQIAAKVHKMNPAGGYVFS